MRIALLLVVAVLSVSTLSGPALGAPCASGTLQDYIDLGAGCTIGAVTFSNFTELAPPIGATAISPAAIGVTPLASASNPGLLLALDITVTAGQFLDAFFGFQVSDTLTGASLVMAGASATGDGAVTVIEDLCRGATFSGVVCPGDSSTQIVFATEVDSDTAEATSFPGVGLLGVLADIGVDGGPTGSAELATVTLRFETGAAAVAEPSSLVLLPLAMLAAWLRRRAPLPQAVGLRARSRIPEVK